MKSCKVALKQMVSYIEWRHIFGAVFGDDGKPIPFHEELDIFKRVLSNLQQEFPLFDYKIIVCGLKIVGHDFCKQQFDLMCMGLQTSDLIVGYDLVCEEDTNPPLKDYMQMLIDIKKKQQELKFDFFFHGK